MPGIVGEDVSMAKDKTASWWASLVRLAVVLAAGVVASLAASALMLLLRLVAGIVTLPELLAELILPNLDAGTFVSLLIRYGKIEPLIAALLGQIALGIVIAPLYPLVVGELVRRLDGTPSHRAGWPSRTEWLAGGILAATLWLVALGLFWPVLAENLWGFPVLAARLLTMAGLAAIFGCYGAALALADHTLTRAVPRAGSESPLADPTRRALLTRAGIASLAGLLLGGTVVDVLVRALDLRSNLGYEGMETFPPIAALTPTSRFYVVSKNVLDPQVAASDWRLDVGGLVRQPGSYDLSGIQRLPAETRPITLECIANGVDGHLLSTATWHGVTLAEVLSDRGGALSGATQVRFTSADGYQSSLPLADLLAVRTLLAWQMNGIPLPDHHGYPLRVVVPGRFGEQSPKWLTRIELLDHAVKGFYQRQGWYDGPVYTISRIDAPGKGARLSVGKPVQLRGVAYAGTRGIAAVEVSTDGGATWQAAPLDRALSKETWALWTYLWTPGASGPTTLIVRATDGTGAPQITREQGTVPNGGTGLHKVPVEIIAA
jgi:DMSO/TMAO reductase YedYZ molybdopterin-dependent catalytic subunit